MELDIPREKLPSHVAIIMDGNGRWAKKRGLPRFFGHMEGVKRVRPIVEKTVALGIPYLTLYAFSKENWQRPEEEKKVLFELLIEYLKKEVPELKEKGVRLNTIGDLEDFPENVQKIIYWAKEETKQCEKLLLTLALSYGGRSEILRAVRLISQEVQKGKISPEEIDEALFRKFLYTSNIPDPDLLIRTGGEIRISNFLIFQCAYTEFYFTRVFWPDFTEDEYMKALADYARRERRFGRV